MTNLPGNKKSVSVPAWIILALTALYAGYCMGKIGKASPATFTEELKYWIFHPYPFEVTEWTLKYVMLCFMAWGILFTMYASTIHNYMAGEEYGASRFAKPEELNKMLRNREVDDNKIISQSLRLSRDGRFTKLNNNMIILGGAGAGKTMFALTPNLLEIRDRSRKHILCYVLSGLSVLAAGTGAVLYLNRGNIIFEIVAFAGAAACAVLLRTAGRIEKANAIPRRRVSKVFTDSKGEILRENGNYCHTRGDKVLVFNLIEMEKSNGYNPFKYIRNENDVIKLVTNLITNTTPKDSTTNDPFWVSAESMLLMSIFYYVWLECDMEERNFRKVLELLNMAEIHEEDEEKNSELDRKMYALDKDHPARIAYRKVMSGAADTKRSILISAQARLKFLQNEKVLRILDHDEMNLPEMGRGVNYDGESVTDLFCVIPDNDKSYNFLVGLLYSQLFQELYYQADFKCGGYLDVPVEFWLDEFYNVALPDDFISLESTMRSRGISVNVIIQFMAQLKALFKDLEEGVPANCDVFVYLGGNEVSSHKYVAERLGDWTIEKKSTSESLGHNGSSSKSNDVLGRKLMTPDEVGRMDNRKEIVFVRGQYPVLDWKYRTFKTKEFRESRALGKYEGIGEDLTGMHFSNEKEISHLKEEADENEIPVQIYKPDMLDIFKMDISKLGGTGGNESAMDIDALVRETEEARQASLAEEEKLRKDIAEKEAAIAELETGKKENVPQASDGTSREDPQDTMNFAKRMSSFPFTKAQLEQAMLGIDHGLTEEIVLTYFRIENSAENMALMRELAEKAMVAG